jgi:hypothetical protein
VGRERNGVHPATWVQLRNYLEKKSSETGQENRDYGRRDPLLRPRGNLYPQKLILTPPRSCGRSVGIVRSRTQRLLRFSRVSSVYPGDCWDSAFKQARGNSQILP